jgi:hypothetical protein
MTCIFAGEAPGQNGFHTFFDTGVTYFVALNGEFKKSDRVKNGRQVRLKTLPPEARAAIRKLERGSE